MTRRVHLAWAIMSFLAAITAAADGANPFVPAAFFGWFLRGWMSAPAMPEITIRRGGK